MQAWPVQLRTSGGADGAQTNSSGCRARQRPSREPWGSDLWDSPTAPSGEGDPRGGGLSDGPRIWMIRGGNGGEKRSKEGKTNTVEERLWCRNSGCVAATALLTLLPLPGQHYQNASSNCKHKKNHYDAWREDVHNHIESARKKEFLFSRCSSEADSGGSGTERARRKWLQVTGFALGGREAGVGMVRLQAGHGAKQTENCRGKWTLGSESFCLFTTLKISSWT